MDVVSETVRSARLDLVPFAAEYLTVSLAGKRQVAEKHLVARQPAGWPYIDEEDGLEEIYERNVP